MSIIHFGWGNHHLFLFSFKRIKFNSEICKLILSDLIVVTMWVLGVRTARYGTLVWSAGLRCNLIKLQRNVIWTFRSIWSILFTSSHSPGQEEHNNKGLTHPGPGTGNVERVNTSMFPWSCLIAWDNIARPHLLIICAKDEFRPAHLARGSGVPSIRSYVHNLMSIVNECFHEFFYKQ